MTNPAFIHEMDVRWGDLDAFNHVNNTVFLRFIEEARIRYFASLGLSLDAGDSGPVVVHIDCSFRRAITYPARVRISVDAHRASERRLVMRHQLTDTDDNGLLYAEAEVTAVWVDSRSGRAVPLPAAVTRALPRGDGGPGDQ
ncbi:MAG: thioesterase family protein [Gammaproteobacteria bacterium]